MAEDVGHGEGEHMFLGGCKVVLGDDRQTSRQPALAVDDDVDGFVLEEGIAVPGEWRLHDCKRDLAGPVGVGAAAALSACLQRIKQCRRHHEHQRHQEH